MRLSDTGKRWRAPMTSGPYNSPDQPDWANATAVTYPCEHQPETTDENTADAQRVESRWRVFLPADADITAVDRWEHAGVMYEVDGAPEPWRVAGVVHHIEVRVKLVTGG